MANVLLTIDMITREALRVLANKLGLVGRVNRQYDKQYANDGAKIGSVLRIRKPERKLVTRGAALVVQPANQDWTTLAVSNQAQISLAFTSAERTMSLDNFSKLFIEPCMSQMAAYIDNDVAQGVIQYIGQTVGIPGTTPATANVLMAGMQKLDEAAVPRDSRYTVVNPAANAALVLGMTGFFNPQQTISNQFKEGMMGANVLGYKEIAMSQSIGQFTTGTRVAATVATTVTTNGQTTLALTLSGGTATDTIKAGDVFTVGSVFSVNPQTRQTTGSLYQFVALADAVGVGSAITVTVPAMYGPDQALATINSFPQSGATITFVGGAALTYPQNLIFQEDAITFATADLEMPDAGTGVKGSRMNYDGLSVRILNFYDGQNDRQVTRFDILYGFGVIRPEMACRLVG